MSWNFPNFQSNPAGAQHKFQTFLDFQIIVIPAMHMDHEYQKIEKSLKCMLTCRAGPAYQPVSEFILCPPTQKCYFLETSSECIEYSKMYAEKYEIFLRKINSIFFLNSWITEKKISQTIFFLEDFETYCSILFYSWAPLR